MGCCSSSEEYIPITSSSQSTAGGTLSPTRRMRIRPGQSVTRSIEPDPCLPPPRVKRSLPIPFAQLYLVSRTTAQRTRLRRLELTRDKPSLTSLLAFLCRVLCSHTTFCGAALLLQGHHGHYLVALNGDPHLSAHHDHHHHQGHFVFGAFVLYLGALSVL